jgi:hypothetical protein
MNEEKNVWLHKVAQKLFEEVTAASLGATFHVIISFHLKQKFGKDPYEVLIENPKIFYNGLKEVLGEGAEAVIKLIGTYITTKYDIHCTVEEFTRLFTRNGKLSTQKLSEIFATIVTQEEQKLRVP